jgi:hypothetical protein
MAQSAKNLQDLFSETLKDIYCAEKKNPHEPSEDGQGGAVGRPSGCL